MQWQILLLAGLWVVPAVAQQPAATGDWTRLPPKELIFSQEALKFSYGEIERMRDDELEAFRQMLATCSTSVLSKNELATAPCDRAAEYFEMVYTRGVALLDILKAIRLHWSIWRNHTGPVGERGKEIEQLVHIQSNWKAAARLRKMRTD